MKRQGLDNKNIIKKHLDNKMRYYRIKINKCSRMNDIVMGRNIDNYEIIFLLVMYLLLVDRVSLKDRQLSLRVNSEGELELQ